MSVAERMAPRRLGELLVERQAVTPAQLEHALSTRLDRRERLGQALVRLGHLGEGEVAEALAQQFSLPVADVEKLTGANRDAMQLVPDHLAREAQVLALARHGNILEVAVSDPLDVLSLDHLRALTGCTLHVHVARPSELAEAIDQF